MATGYVAGRADVARATVATGTAAYSSGDMIGTAVTFTNLNYIHSRGAIVALTAVTQSGGSLPFSLFVFSDAPTVAADNAPATFAAADLSARLCGVLSVATTDYVLAGSAAVPPCVATPDNRLITYTLDAASALHACAVARGSFTFSGTSDLVLTLSVFED